MTMPTKAGRLPLRLEILPAQKAAAVCILAIAIFSVGCAAQQVDSRWRTEKIAADGSDGEWQDAPQYYDRDQQMTVRVANDGQAFYLCLSTGSDPFARQLRMTGLTIWLDPAGGQSKVLGIHIPGGEPGRTGSGPGGPLSPEARPPDSGPKKAEGAGGHRPPAPRSHQLQKIAITYKDTTGPLTMELDEVRRTGIDIGIDRLPDQRLVVEFKIRFTAAPCLESLEPGMALGLGVQSGESGSEKRQQRGGSMGPGDRSGGRGGPPSDGGGMGAPPSGGGMGGPPSGGGGRGPGAFRDGGKDNIEIWLQVLLARPAAEG